MVVEIALKMEEFPGSITVLIYRNSNASKIRDRGKNITFYFAVRRENIPPNEADEV